MGESSMAIALQSAGYETVDARLLRFVAESVREPAAEPFTDPDSDRQQRRLMQVAKESIKASPRNWDGAKDALYSKIRSDAALLWELFAPYRSQAVQMLLTQAATELREEERPRLVAGGGAGQMASVRPENAARSARAGMEAAAAVARKTLLDTFRVNGKPIGDLTPQEANAWASSRERDARFVRLLTANLPPDRPIREFRTGEDAQELYAQAEATRDE